MYHLHLSVIVKFVLDINQESLTQEYSSCSPLDCDQSCRRIGFPGGACVNGKCKCDIMLSLTDFNQESLTQEYSSCSPLSCDQSCRRLGFPGGACVNGKCKCDIMLSLTGNGYLI
ncbi:unnamed protein product [Parnassius mnemosyne]|uniref:Defensin-like protein n=1 Tax=Parnassius mnemosyne TaxID=213953 RepID=A0AAV1LEQ4_9NEOP